MNEPSPYNSIFWRFARGALVMAAAFVVGAIIMYLIWNNGIAHAFHAKDISFTTAFWLNVGILFVGNRFKGVTTNVFATRPPGA